MNRDALAVALLFGLAAFLYSRQSQASQRPSFTPSGAFWEPVMSAVEQAEQAIEEIVNPTPQLEPQGPGEPVDPATTEAPPFVNPIPPLPAI